MRCKACGKRTRERKPFCSEHIDQMPYVQELVRNLERQRAEDQAVNTPFGHQLASSEARSAKEIMIYLLERGPATSRRLASHLNLPALATSNYVHALLREGLVEEVPGNRTSAWVVINAEGRDWVQALME